MREKERSTKEDGLRGGRKFRMKVAMKRWLNGVISDTSHPIDDGSNRMKNLVDRLNGLEKEQLAALTLLEHHKEEI